MLEYQGRRVFICHGVMKQSSKSKQVPVADVVKAEGSTAIRYYETTTVVLTWEVDCGVWLLLVAPRQYN